MKTNPEMELEKEMKQKNACTVWGGILCILAVGYVVFALTHPELSFPWKNWATYVLYALYAIYTILVFWLPRGGSGGLAACGVIGIQIAAIALIFIYFGMRGTPYQSDWIVISSLLLTSASNFTNLAYQRKRRRKEEAEEGEEDATGEEDAEE